MDTLLTISGGHQARIRLELLQLRGYRSPVAQGL